MQEIIKGIVIKKSDSGEFDEVISTLCKTGIYTFFSPGTRKINSKNAMSLSLLDFTNFEILTRNEITNLLPRLKTAMLIYKFPLDYQNAEFQETLLYFLNKIKASNYLDFIETYEKLLPMVGHNKNNKVLVYLINKILKCEGIYPVYSGCVECGRQKGLIDFQFHKGGFLCYEHSTFELGVNKLNALYYLNKDFDSFDKNTTHDVVDFLKKMIITYLTEYF
ncbi:hypothetical protein [Metamycoplasma hyosynoviae]|uniref:hypothetical protein n=1 Tax=Metamycoplasma hyosynoviae TaxID=29559 RepID=UPI00236559C3|nr:hypothetical protein [Metamycoplasma hyosynoviae]MDD7912670.1 hypothetical protein [Metamycoplasma hyosynoviae]